MKKKLLEFPELMKEWDWRLNEELNPEHLTEGSGKKAWWKCSICGNIWQASIAARTKGSRCKFCCKLQAKGKINDLASVNPALAAQWHPSKNGDLKPSMVSRGSNRTVWWLCHECGYEWTASICNRARGRKCPECNRLERKNRNKQNL